MTREEAKREIDSLDYYLQNHTDDYGEESHTAMMMAIQALEQEPKAVLYSGDGYADGYMVFDMAECPNCGYEYEDGDKDWGLPFCPSCGQKLNWERSDKE